ncbi:3-methyl-2-oxobutanoate hydroxymethyltransferase [Campylobacter sp. US33a]|uniref:3-methyl-2-oxobutanoate hydroxymethyltransferase n=1 Tax=Campylobacter sp. CCS1377 TaxID=3158229 RepID=A0AAU7E5R8_9BACT|nr:3-methyl-2-oxobutanoate hydroxymethyltransferase [Campylobacter sp. US33a]MCW1360950.1 3-methyl-2-oxobutanoate hydroxymethyltransferase [Campylobacter jejuni]TEY01613.1 3-methyl-2-oxobutanoate hydroxymethyltransferase [Campylobacter sp. US33a]
MKNTILTLQDQKKNQDKIIMLTAYDYFSAKLADEAGVNVILVGDSLGMVVLGYKDTLSVSMQDMLFCSAAVARGAKNAFVLTDMPFMSYQSSVYDALVNAGRLVKEGGANAVKLEGADFCEHISAISKASIPVVAHLGLTPQSLHTLGGYRVQGKSLEAAKKLIDDAKAVQDAGAVMLVLECVPEKLAQLITKKLEIPTIGIGAGKYCDGQVLVYHDLLGLNDEFKPKFVKHFANTKEVLKQGINSYIKEVKEEKFPSLEHSFSIDDELIEKLY